MIETLILGIILGNLVTVASAAYCAYRYLKQPYTFKVLSDGYEVVVIDRKVSKDDKNHVIIMKDDEPVGSLWMDKKHISDIFIYDC